MEVVRDNGFLNSGAGDTGEGREGTIWEVPAVPKVDGSGIAVIRNKLAVIDTDKWEGIEVGCGADKGRAGSKEAEVEGPKVFKGRADVPERASADQGAIGKACAVVGDNQTTNGGDQLTVVIHGKEEKEHMVGENRDDKSVNIENAVGEREGTNKITVGGEAFEGFIKGFGENIAEGNGTTDRNT